MSAKFESGDEVRISETAIRQCRQYFGRRAQWQRKDGDRVFIVVNVIDDKQNDIYMLEVQEKGKTEIEQIAACHMEPIP